MTRKPPGKRAREQSSAAQGAVYWDDRADGLRITLVGNIDKSHYARLTEALAAVERSPRGVTIDLEHATFVDSTTLGVFAILHSHSHAAGKPLILYKPQAGVLKVLTVVGFDHMMQTVPAE